eukprot:TRINITY_DN356_c0_g1_i1.p2 TRINITY_DN356_c0_g1~~TRINITY_DN356_c0_g1_i1.p2  ORF type:complete len:116 (+),score=35.28 TRINITY_DN356_c0_g1_i1:42-389(+)
MAAPTNVNELAVTFASLILHDDGIEITADKIAAVTKAAGLSVQPVWARLFSKALAGKDLDDLILNAGGSGPAAGGAAPAAAAAGGAAAAEAPKEEAKKEEEEEESDDDMGFGLFD